MDDCNFNECDWFAEFDERQQSEIKFADVYADQYQHGTDGHHRLMIIAQMTEKLCRLEREVKHWRKTNTT